MIQVAWQEIQVYLPPSQNQPEYRGGQDRQGAKDEGLRAKEATAVELEQDDEESADALVLNYDLMLHYLFGHLRRADCT
jgi:hypothetical protein